MAVMAPTRDTPAMELRLGSWDSRTAALVKTRYHSTVVRWCALHVPPHRISKNILHVPPPRMIRDTQVPPARYMKGNSANQFASFSPEI